MTSRARKVDMPHAALAVVIACLGMAAYAFQPVGAAAPSLSGNPDGTLSASWNFTSAADYSFDNTTLAPSGAILAFEPLSWTLDSVADFQGGAFTNAEGNASGDVRLALTAQTELLQNGNFTALENGFTGNWIWSRSTPNSSAIWEQAARVATEGYLDDGPCWNNTFQDFNPGEGGSSYIWLNQTFIIPTIPRSVNISVMHEFVNVGVGFSPGAQAFLSAYNNQTNVSLPLDSTLPINLSSPFSLLSDEIDSSFFNSTGLYKISLMTMVDTSGNPSYFTLSGALFHLWDNASVKYTAYNPTGRYVSEIYDSGSTSFWKNASWGATEPLGSNVTVRVRSGDSNNTYDSSWSPWSNVLANASGTSLFLQPTRYFQFMVDLDTAFTNRTPSLDWLNFNYEKYHANGTVETGDFAPASVEDWGYFSHSEDLAGQDVAFHYSTDGGASWVAVPAGGDMRSVAIEQPGARLRFRASLRTSDSSVTPAVEWMRLVYVGTNPALTLECVWNKPRPVPGESVRLEAYVNNTAPYNSSSAWLNLSLPTACVDYVSWGSDSVGLRIVSQQVNASTATTRFVFADVSPGSYHIWVEANVRPGVADGAIHSSGGSLVYTDPLDVLVASASAQSNLVPKAPVLALWAECPEGKLDVGEVARYAVSVNNTGDGPASAAWLNVTLDEKFSYFGSSGGSLEGGKVRWRLDDIGPHENITLYCNASLDEDAAHGESLETLFAADYLDTAGFKRSVVSGQLPVESALASNMSFSFVSSAGIVHPRDNLVATAYFNNSGYGTALSVNISVLVPQSLALNGSNQAYEVSGHTVFWNFSDVGPGPHSFAVTFTALDTGVKNVSATIHAEMRVVDQVRGQMGMVAEDGADISIIRISSIWEKIYWPWSGAGAAAALSLLAFALWMLYKPTPPGITDIFFIYKDGRLISHRSAASSMRRDMDEDLVSGMLTAVQQFVSDSLSERGTDNVKRLEFGEKEILIERGKTTYLAVIYTGDMNRKLNSRIGELVRKIEADYPWLAEWNGSSRNLEPIGGMLDQLINEWQSSKPSPKNSLDEVDEV